MINRINHIWNDVCDARFRGVLVLAVATITVAALGLKADRVVYPIVSFLYTHNDPVSNAIFKNKGSHGIEHYVELMGQRVVGLALSALVGAAASWALWVRLPRANRRKHVLAVVALGLCVGAVLTGITHDYPAYLEIWSLVNRLDDPWKEGSGNAYGPLFNLLSPLAAVNIFIPKILFVTLLLAYLVHYLIQISPPSDPASRTVFQKLALLAAAPFLAGVVVLQGNFDIIPAVLAVLALRYRLRSRDMLAGALLGAAVLFKFYPILILPFILLEPRKGRGVFAASCLGVVAGGLLFSMLLWGPSTLSPLVYNTTRHSKLLSIFNFLRHQFSTLRLYDYDVDVDRFSLPMMALGISIVLATSARRRIGAALGCIAGSVTALALYKVGHQQFQAMVVLLVLDWILTTDLRAYANRRLAIPMIVYIAWLSLFEAFFGIDYMLHGYEGELGAKVKQLCGLPHFLIALYCVIEILRWGRNDREFASAPSGLNLGVAKSVVFAEPPRLQGGSDEQEVYRGAYG